MVSGRPLPSRVRVFHASGPTGTRGGEPTVPAQRCYRGRCLSRRAGAPKTVPSAASEQADDPRAAAAASTRGRQSTATIKQAAINSSGQREVVKRVAVNGAAGAHGKPKAKLAGATRRHVGGGGVHREHRFRCGIPPATRNTHRTHGDQSAGDGETVARVPQGRWRRGKTQGSEKGRGRGRGCAAPK